MTWHGESSCHAKFASANRLLADTLGEEARALQNVGLVGAAMAAPATAVLELAPQP